MRPEIEVRFEASASDSASTEAKDESSETCQSEEACVPDRSVENAEAVIEAAEPDAVAALMTGLSTIWSKNRPLMVAFGP